MDEHTIYHNLMEAMQKPACPICRLCDTAVDRYLDHLLYSDVNSIERRAEIRSARGFCADHAAMLLDIGRQLGIAIIYKDVIDNLMRDMPAPGDVQGGLVRLLGKQGKQREGIELPATPCPACSHYLLMQGIYVSAFAEHLKNPSFRQREEGSDGLCLTHFRQALAERMDRERRQHLINGQMARWQRLSDELGEYIRKNDYRFRTETFGEEEDAPARALRSISDGRDIKEGT